MKQKTDWWGEKEKELQRKLDSYPHAKGMYIVQLSLLNECKRQRDKDIEYCRAEVIREIEDKVLYFKDFKSYDKSFKKTGWGVWVTKQGWEEFKKKQK
jgi:hypothetical protein